MVLDPFCGCGNDRHAAGRWAAADRHRSHASRLGLIRKRLVEAFPTVQYEVFGVPKDLGAARTLAEADKYQFQFWALSMVRPCPTRAAARARTAGGGLHWFKPDGKATEKAVVSIKGGGNVGAA